MEDVLQDIGECMLARAEVQVGAFKMDSGESCHQVIKRRA